MGGARADLLVCVPGRGVQGEMRKIGGLKVGNSSGPINIYL